MLQGEKEEEMKLQGGGGFKNFDLSF